MSIRDQVSEFHREFGIPMADIPSVPSDERVRLRAMLITEEFKEVILALGWFVDVTFRGFNQGVSALSDVAKELADLDYVIEGTRLELGIDGAPIAALVHRSNMSKLGPDGKPVFRADGKVTKGPNYSPPDIAGELERQRSGRRDTIATAALDGCALSAGTVGAPEEGL